MRCVVSWQEEKKPEQGKKEEPKAKEENKGEDGKKGGGGGGGEGEKKEGGGEEKKADEPPPPPPEEIVMRVYMHCEGCARKVKRSLKGFEGVEDVKTDCRTHKVVVKGKKAAEDPMKVVERVQKKAGRKVELLTPLPPPKPEKKEEEKTEEEKPKVEEKKEEPQVIAVVLKVHMHCEACAQEIKKRILKMKGVQAAEPDLKASQVTVKGVFDPQKLGEYVYKRTGKQAVVAKQEPAEKKAEDDKGGGGDAAKDEKKADEAGGGNAEGEKKEEKDGGGGQGGGDEKDKKEGGGAAEDGAAPATKVVELVRNEFYQYYPRYPGGYVGYAYPPQMFSDENPNACAVM
ncbi:unnamed protein product [Musa banksii]